jgi:N-succinyldiaminopimelate aminotransferase
MPRHPGLAPTSAALSQSAFSASSLARHARDKRGTLHRLHVGDTYLEPPADARAETIRCADHPRLHNYSPVHGEPALLEAILERHPGLERDDLQVMAGATGGLHVTCQSLLSPADEVLILAPFWPLIRGIVAARGAVPVEVPFYDRLDDPGFDVAATLDAAINERTVAIYVNSPNNPLGTIVARQAVDALAGVVRRHSLWLLCDEAYESLAFTDPQPTPIWQHPDLAGHTVATHTVSKSHGLAGARVGYTHGPHEAMRAIRNVQTFHTYCAARPMQLAAARALREGDAWLCETRNAYARAAECAAAALGVPPPSGGTFLFFDTRPHRRPGEQPIAFLERCVDAGVLLMPGSNSGSAYEDWARLCFTVVAPEELEDALERLTGVFAG